MRNLPSQKERKGNAIGISLVERIGIAMWRRMNGSCADPMWPVHYRMVGDLRHLDNTGTSELNVPVWEWDGYRELAQIALEEQELDARERAQ